MQQIWRWVGQQDLGVGVGKEKRLTRKVFVVRLNEIMIDQCHRLSVGVAFLPVSLAMTLGGGKFTWNMRSLKVRHCKGFTQAGCIHLYEPQLTFLFWFCFCGFFFWPHIFVLFLFLPET